MANGKKDTPVSIKENNKTVISTSVPAVELVVVGDHLEFDKNATNRGVRVGGI